MKKAVGVAIMVILSMIVIAPASAITPVPPLKSFVCYPIITKGIAETYSAWVVRLDAVTNGSTCYTFSSTRYKSYKNYLGIARTQVIIVDKANEYDKRLQACKVSNTSFLIGDLKCVFKVSFFPSSDVIKDSIDSIGKSVKTHQPMSYIPVGYNIITNSFDAMGGKYCSASGGNALDYSVPLLKGVKKMEFIFPCQPPPVLRVFRTYLVSFLYLGFALWLYGVAVKWWDKREKS